MRTRLHQAALCLALAGGICLEAQEFLPRTDSGARLEPRGMIMHGAGQDPESLARYMQALPEETQPVVTMAYIGLKDLRPNWASQLRARLLSDPLRFQTLQLGLSMTRDGEPGSAYEAEVAAGTYDEQIRLLGSGLRSLTVPVYLRIGYEFNGLSWNGYLPESYKGAFRRIVDLLREEQPNLEVATVWCAAIDGTRNFEDFYPGDEYVDWYGIDIFDARHFADDDVRRFVEDAAARSKPVMLGETTPRGQGAQRPEAWAGWFEPFFNWMRATPQVKQFNYINWDWAEKSAALNQPGWANWGDARLETELASAVRERYIEALREPGAFQHGLTESEFRQSLGREEAAAPEAPAGLTLAGNATGGVGIEWQGPAADSGVEIARYYFYRDGELADFSTLPTILDERARAGTTVTYQVAVMSRAGTLSPPSEPLEVRVESVIRSAEGFDAGELSPWQMDTFHDGAKASAAIDEGAARVQVNEATGTGWHVQFRRFVQLHEGLRYKVSLRARADRPMTVRLWLQQTETPNTIYSNFGLPLAEEWKTFEFEARSAASVRTALSFVLGAAPAGSTVWIDDVQLIELSEQ